MSESLSTTAGPSQVVLVVSASESVARHIESYLRNAGHPVRCVWAVDLDDVDSALRGGTPDLLIVADGLKAAALQDVVELRQRLMPDVPVLALYDSVTPENTVAALAAGAADQVSDQDLRHMRHLELVVLRELGKHRHLRELRRTRQQLTEFESRHKQLVADTNDAVAHIQEGIISSVNPAFAQLLGYDNVDDLSAVPLMDVVAPDHQPKAKEYLKLLYRGKNEGKALECALLRADGQRVAIKARMTQSIVEGEHLLEMLIHSEGTVGAAAPVASQTQQAPDRLAFFDGLSASIAATGQQKGQRAAMLFIVNDFEAFEERLGLHDAAEAVEQLQDWLKSQLADGDQLYRFSTNEIAAVVTRPGAVDIMTLGEKLAAEVSQQIFNTAGHEAQCALTIAAYPFSGSENAAELTAELVRDARKLSASGNSQFANLGPTAESSLEEREHARKAEMVRKALDENRLKLAYQSIASLEGDTRQHFDVLVRVIDEHGKEVHAAEFIPACEKLGLMPDVDRWVTARALKVQAKRDSADEPSSLFVKLSESTLKDAENFVAWMREQVEQRALRPNEIVFEFRELVVQNHIRKAKLLTKALVDFGAQIAIEHFGMGSNSAQFIEHIPIHFLKFHPTFTSNFSDKNIHQKMVNLMDAAKQKKIKLIVSHVEDANVMARLWQMGVNFIQGYHVQEPEVVLLSADVRG